MESWTPTSGSDGPDAELWADAAWVEGRTAELMAGGVEWRPGAPDCSAASAPPVWPRHW